MQKMMQCPCGSQQPYAQCCEPYHKETSTPLTAEALMRSRYSAYTLNLTHYIYTTWHPDTRPTQKSLESGDVLWLKLVINNAENKNEDVSFVDFNAFYQINDQLFTIHEVSRFLKIKNKWFYIDGKIS